MNEVQCPECGTVADLDELGPSVEGFCNHCDFPLFWAHHRGSGPGRAAAPDETSTGADQMSLRRLPGIEGLELVLGTECPHCGEFNKHATQHCVRCANELQPEPPTGETPAPEPLPLDAVNPPTPKMALDIVPLVEDWAWNRLARSLAVLSGILLVSLFLTLIM